MKVPPSRTQGLDAARRFELSAAPALEQLICGYPDYVRVSALRCETDDDKLEIARSL
jgi:hypothetical protein